MARSKLSREGPCSLCGQWRASLHRDHVVPRFMGGSDDWSNIQLLCANCHEDKTREDHRRPEYRELLRQRNFGKGPPPNKGKRHSPEAIQRMRATWAKRREMGLKPHFGEEQRQKVTAHIVALNRQRAGVPHTEEHKQKIRESTRAALAARQSPNGREES